MVRPHRIADHRAWETETLEAGKIRKIQNGVALLWHNEFTNLRKPLKVILSAGAAESVRMKGNRLEVITKSTAPDDILARTRAWYPMKGRDYITRRLDVLIKDLPWIKAPPPARFLEMSRQWGSCSPKGEDILNPHLIKALRTCIDYALIHEIAHIKHHDHSPEFWSLSDAHAVDWRAAQHHLDKLVEMLLRG